MPQHTKATVHQSLRGESRTFSSQLFDDVLYTRVAEITDAIGNEVNTLYQGTTIDPLLARMPAFDRRRVQDLLPICFISSNMGSNPGLGAVQSPIRRMVPITVSIGPLILENRAFLKASE